MENATVVLQLRKDTPESHDDELGLRPFVTQLSSAIASIDESESWVISIEAPWGRGKTWCLRELKRQLEAKHHGIHRVEDFNPWMLGDHLQIVQTLLRKIEAWANDSTITALKEIGTDIRAFAKALPAIHGLGEHLGVGLSLGSVVAAVSKIPNENAERADPDKLKVKVVKALKDADTRLFVFIDDLDRVTPDEFVAMIRAIKAVADFPHVIYVLALDAQIADQQLKAAGIARGGEYLDKIIQLRAPLPPISLSHKRVLIDAAMKALPREMHSGDSSHRFQQRMAKLFNSGLAASIRSPRDVKRVANRIQLLPSEVFRDVNLADLFALATIEIVDPSMFATLCDSARAFVSKEIPHETTGDATRRHFDKDKQTTAQNYAKEIVDRSAKPATRQLLHALFPRIAFEAASQNSHFDLLGGHIAHERNLYAALQGLLPSDLVPIHVIRTLIRSKPTEFEGVYRSQRTKYSLSQILQGLAAVLPFERLSERNHIWSFLTRETRDDALGREDGQTLFVISHAKPLVDLIYWTEKFSRSDASGSLLPFSFRDWVVEHLSEKQHAMFWPCVLTLCETQGDKPLDVDTSGAWVPKPDQWNADLLGKLIAKHQTFLGSESFLDEPESGDLLGRIAESFSDLSNEIANRLLSSDTAFDRLAYRLVTPYCTGDETDRRYFVRFHGDHPFPAETLHLVDRAKSRLEDNNLSLCVRLACAAIANQRTQIEPHLFSGT